jgi:protein SCO1
VLVILVGILCLVGAGLGLEASRLGPSRPAAERFAYGSRAQAGGPLPTLWRVPEFAFPDQHRTSVAPSALAGKVWIADFIFTTCTTVCPVLSAKMVMLQHQLTAPDLRFVSFSVDPEHDQPEVLARYAQEWNASESRWRLLATDAAGLARIADGMHVAVAPTGDAQNPILHSSVFFLVDGQGDVRGIYDSADDEALRRLVVDAATLVGTAQAATPPSEATGQQLYGALGCAACHDNERLAPNLRGLLGRQVTLDGGAQVTADASYLRAALVTPGQQLVAGYLNIMPSYSEVLSAEQLDGLLAYVQSLSPPAPPTVVVSATPEPPPKKAVRGPVVRAVARDVPATTSLAVAEAPATISVDPVCQMKVRVGKDTPSATHDGHSYHFCSERCRAEFVASPAKYMH